MTERPLWRLVAGRKKGPYPPEKLRALVRDGRISSLDRFSIDGETWQTADAFPELFREPPPASAPTPAGPDGIILDENVTAGDDLVLPDDVSTDDDDLSTRRLMHVVAWVVGVGSGLIALPLILTLFSGGSDPAPQDDAVTVGEDSVRTAPAVESAAGDEPDTGDEAAVSEEPAAGDEPATGEEPATGQEPATGEEPAE